MKLLCTFFLLVVLCFGASPGARGSAPRAGEPAQVAGREYVRVTDWAKANGFQIRWLKRQGTFQLSNASARITCAVDSREAQVNGVGVWLSFPVAQREGVPYLAKLDLQTTLAPLRQKIKRVLLSNPFASIRAMAAKTLATASALTRKRNTRCCWPRKFASNSPGRD